MSKIDHCRCIQLDIQKRVNVVGKSNYDAVINGL